MASPVAFAKVYYAPPGCETAEAHFNLQNKKNRNLDIGLHVWNEQSLTGETLTLKPNDKVSLQLDQSLEVNFVDFANLFEATTLKMLCPKLENSLELSSQTSPVSYFKIKQNGVFRIKNISQLKNPVKLSFKNGDTWQEFTTRELHFKESAAEIQTHFQNFPVEIKIESEFRSLTAFIEQNSYIKPSSFGVKKILREKDKNKYKYFLVGMKKSNGQFNSTEESYIVRMQNQEQIQQAREAIAKNKELIVIGEVGLGHGGFNRDMSDHYKSPYSWHIKQVTSLSELASDACNGHPLKLEFNLTDWVSYNPYACFWPYRLIKEIPESAIDSE